LCAALLAVAGTAMAITADPSGNTAPAPTIQSDKADYSPGELVTLTGSNWQPGESVNIVVNDDAGQT
jgi:Putative Ig domain